MQQIHGFLVADSQVKEAHGSTVVTFRVAVYRNFQDQAGEWKTSKREFECAWWGVQRIQKYLLAGRLVIMTGTMNVHEMQIEADAKPSPQLTFRVESLEWFEISHSAPHNPLVIDDFTCPKG
jgi:single-stranded DNA-binding protein